MMNKTIYYGSRNIIKLDSRINAAEKAIDYKDELNCKEITTLLQSSDDRILQIMNAYMLGYEAGLHAASHRPITGRRHRR